jgi:hypothetical protein
MELGPWTWDVAWGKKATHSLDGLTASAHQPIHAVEPFSSCFFSSAHGQHAAWEIGMSNRNERKGGVGWYSARLTPRKKKFAISKPGYVVFGQPYLYLLSETIRSQHHRQRSISVKAVGTSSGFMIQLPLHLVESQGLRTRASPGPRTTERHEKTRGPEKTLFLVAINSSQHPSLSRGSVLNPK